VVKENLAAQPTRADASFPLAIIFFGQASKLPEGVADRGALYGSSITALDSLLINIPRGTPTYNSAVFQRALAYEARGASILDHNNAMEGFAQIANLEDSKVDATLKRSARSHLIAVATTAGAREMAASNDADPAAAQRAISLYEKARLVEPNNAAINLGLGNARLIIARSAPEGERATWYDSALKAFTVASAGGAEGSTLGLARASRGLGQLSTAITYYISAGSDPAVLGELAETQVQYAKTLTDPGAKRTAYQAAEGTLKSLLRPTDLPKDRRASLLIRLAEVQGQQDGRVADVRKTLEEAVLVDGQSPGTNLQLAQNYYAQNLFSDAKTYFDKVVTLTGGATQAPPPGPQSKMKAEAYHHLSLIRARDTASAAMLKDTVDLADKAVEIGGRVSPYREQDCIARIKRGGKQVLTGDSICFAADDQAQGLLLRGMFNLKQAQLAEPGAQSGHWNSAKFAFDQGLRQLPNPADASRPTFAWPGAITPAPSVADLLKFGKAVVDGCYGQPVQTDLSAPAITAAKQFYVDYGVFSCR
jgi:tetratricopeptide (TPR) repeat protein